MRNTILFLFVLTLLVSCKKTDPNTESCVYSNIPSFENSTFKLIPINSQNFWVYTDSTWNNGILISEKSTLLKIEDIYDLGGLTAIQFTSILPLLSIQGDTLYSTELTPSNYPNCYHQYFPMFFETDDSLLVDIDPSKKSVFKSTTPVQTPVGIFTNNIVYTEENIFEITSHKNIGIIKISFFIENQKRRTLTLKDYHLY